MAHFTQLGLSGIPDRQEVKPQGKTLPNVLPEGQRPHSNAKKLGGKQKTAALIGSLIATALLGVFVLESGCSKESDKPVAIATPSPTAVSQPPLPISAEPISTSLPVASQLSAKRKSRQRKFSASTYTNPKYGVSFRYPKHDSLKEGDEANLELDGLGPVEMNFVQAGGTTISAVELPPTPYAGTDFNLGFFNVSVNPKLTPEECEQFMFPETRDRETDHVSTKTKIGSAEFRAAEGFAEEENHQADVKYYHVFQNGSCYEFALGLETVEEANPFNPTTKPALKPVNRNEVFRKLNWILSTVKIQPIAAPEKTIPEVATGTSPARTNTAITEAH